MNLPSNIKNQKTIPKVEKPFLITERDIEAFQVAIKIKHTRILQELKLNGPIIPQKEEEGNCLLITMAQLTDVINFNPTKHNSIYSSSNSID
jgi:hypothetical protein